MLRQGLLGLALILGLAAPAGAQDAGGHPAQMMTEASRVFAAGDRARGTYLFYRGQLRWRARLIAGSAEGPAFGALFQTLGPPINEWAFGDIPAHAATIDRVLRDDAADPDPTIPAAAYAQSRQGLMKMRDEMLATAGEIRARRAANGLPNR